VTVQARNVDAGEELVTALIAYEAIRFADARARARHPVEVSA